MAGRNGSRVLTEDRIKILAPMAVELELGTERLSKESIAARLDMTHHTYKTLTSSNLYKQTLAKAIERRERAVERASVESTYEMRQKLNLYSTEAIEVIVELMRNAKAEPVRLSAACEIIDRDGRFAKVSRMMNVNQGQDGAPMLPEDISSEILDALKGVRGTVQ